MKMTFRHYGNDDPISLEYIAQIPGVTGVMVMMNEWEAGEVWEKDVFQEYVDKCHAVGLDCEIIESINVHEDIKMGLPTRDKYIENYKESLRNVAACGVKTVIYNFMPVFDWVKTELYKELPDGSNTLAFDQAKVEGLSPRDMVNEILDGAGNFELPGWEPERLSQLEDVLEKYKDIDEDKLRENYKYFLEAIIPTCEEVGIKMAVHPDDPAWPIFDIPRITSTPEDLEKIVNLVDSPSNTLCICTGSLGSRVENDVAKIIGDFAKRGKIGAIHARNIKFTGEKQFYESAHLSKCGSLDMYAIMKALYDADFDGYLRPDHGRMIWGEEGRAGYGLYDRALGVAYLNGLWEAIDKNNK
ncbi:Mannonate dehydratase [Anaerococcus prevotii]|uniref:Mannonate dehydratase n=1 Tax=Anaerococcus prevotii (strain ATCC 9321 / DSM 20548 / JCM 6508 / NCTC 11806 / PC1) TaxID=525919 RepID=C7REK9_ANAPD|nr:mannonate dehydratase [Anaerococcus prevotii]ACV29622.1 mannonate dehydratase [Anaerococcus prevotii DSM 20548]SUU95296.1 Mannonate dehydratase [Anaerococcus prevotii]